MKLCDTEIPSCRFRYFAISRLDQWVRPVCSGGRSHASVADAAAPDLVDVETVAVLRKR
jgi:predicted nucleic acid-binding protein